MKDLSKFITAAFIAGALFFTGNAKAQTTPAHTFNFNLGAESGLPTGNARKGATFTLGATGRFQYGLTNSLALTFTAGGYHFFPKEIPGTTTRYGSYGEIPIKAGIKAFFMPNIYFSAEAGIAFEKLEQGWGPHRLDLSPTLGWANTHWDIGAHYENFSNEKGHLGLVNIRVAYGIKL